MNGIAGLATAQDLVDRLIRVELPPLHRRRSSAELGQEFEALRPALLGALLDLFSSTLCELPYVRLDDPPRMADFAYLGEAMFRALGRSEGFAQLYRTRQQSTALAELESSPVASAVLILMETTSRWSGPAKFLLDALASFRQDTERWPRSPRGLGDSATPYVRRLGEAMFRALGRSEGFAQLYRTRQQSTALAELESSPVASAVLILMETTSRWSGPAKFLLDALASFRQDTERWPLRRADSATSKRTSITTARCSCLLRPYPSPRWISHYAQPDL